MFYQPDLWFIHSRVSPTAAIPLVVLDLPSGNGRLMFSLLDIYFVGNAFLEGQLFVLKSMVEVLPIFNDNLQRLRDDEKKICGTGR